VTQQFPRNGTTRKRFGGRYLFCLAVRDGHSSLKLVPGTIVVLESTHAIATPPSSQPQFSTEYTSNRISVNHLPTSGGWIGAAVGVAEKSGATRLLDGCASKTVFLAPVVAAAGRSRLSLTPEKHSAVPKHVMHIIE